MSTHPIHFASLAVMSALLTGFFLTGSHYFLLATAAALGLSIPLLVLF